MEVQKVTITIPVSLYRESMQLVKGGLFSNFSELVRSGLRGEYKEFREMLFDTEEMHAIGKSRKEKSVGKVRRFKRKKEMDAFLEGL